MALMIGAAHGMDTTGYTIPYVAGWAANVDGKNPVEVVQAAGERIRKTALSILDGLDTNQVPDGTPPGLERDGPAPKSPRQDTPGRQVAPLPAPERAARSCWGGGCDVREQVYSGGPADGCVLAAGAGRDGVRAVRGAGVPVRAGGQATNHPTRLPRRHHRPGAGGGLVAQVPGGEHRHAHRPSLGRLRGGCRCARRQRLRRDPAPRGGRGWCMAGETMVRSPTGGLHIYFPAADSEQPSWQAGRAGVDFRGDRGYIIVPPSRRQIDGESVLYRPTSFAPTDGRALDARACGSFSPRPGPARRPARSRMQGRWWMRVGWRPG